MQLDYLDFDFSEDSEGVGTFDALASTTPAQLSAVHAEVEAVLAWAHGQFPEGPGAVADGADWDIDLQSLREYSVAYTLDYDTASGRLRLAPGREGQPRHTTSLSISGSQAFCEAFRSAFELG